MLEERVFDDQAQPVESHAYVWSPRYIDSPVLRDSYDSDGQLQSDSRVYYLNDANFNVTALVGLVEVEPDVFEWQVTRRYVYSPYGEATVYDADWSNPAAPSEDGPLYCGYFFDSETSLYHVRHRQYHPTLSQWLTRDPLLYSAADENVYRYVCNTPLTQTDCSGCVGAVYVWIDQSTKPSNFNRPAVEKNMRSVLSRAGVTCQLFLVETVTGKGELDLGFWYTWRYWLPQTEGGDWVNPAWLVMAGVHDIGRTIWWVMPWASNCTIAWGHYVEFSAKRHRTQVQGYAYTPNRTVTTVYSEELRATPGFNSRPTITYANTLLHEVFWLGVLGKRDVPGAPAGTLQSGTASTRALLTITGPQANKINAKFQ